MEPELPWVGQVVGRNLADQRDLMGLTQREAARELSRAGLSWSHQYLASVEKGRRQTVPLADLVSLSHLFQVPLSRWMAGEGAARLNDSTTAQLADLRAALEGDVPRIAVTLSPEDLGDVLEQWAATSAEQHVALRLRDRTGWDVTAEQVGQLSRELWGVSLDEARDARLSQDPRLLDKGSLRSYRSTVTRGLINELEDALRSRGGKP